jgi:hypothetical protein
MFAPSTQEPRALQTTPEFPGDLTIERTVRAPAKSFNDSKCMRVLARTLGRAFPYSVPPDSSTSLVIRTDRFATFATPPGGSTCSRELTVVPAACTIAPQRGESFQTQIPVNTAPVRKAAIGLCNREQTLAFICS